MRPVYIAAIGLVLLYCLSFLTGVIFSMTGFVQSDTCWLVKLGDMMLKSHVMPTSDPFSFTLPMMAQKGFAQPFVLYQWLSEVIFAFTFRQLDLRGLILLSAVTTVIAAICVLFRLCLRSSGKLLLSFIAVTLATASVALRLMVRPEIFTLLFIVLWLVLLKRLSASGHSDSDAGAEADAEASIAVNSESIDWQTIGVITLTMIVWCNLHSGFVIGLLALVIYALSSFCQDKIAKRSLSSQTKTAFISLITCVLGTLLNPAGVNLWTYLPRLFFAPMNASIKEMQAMSTRELLLPIYYPFFVLMAVSIYTIFAVLKSKSETSPNRLSKICTRNRLSSVVTIIIAILVSVFCKRLACPMALLLAFETSALMGSVPQAQAKIQGAFKFFDRKISILALELPVLLLTTVGVLTNADRMVPLTMPQPSSTFHPSFQSVAYMLDNWKGGNVFNNAQIGSVLDMYGPPELKVFIDTRLDAYGDKILNDYCDIIDVRERCKGLLEAYAIDWVILTQRDRLGTVLREAPGWTRAFEDQDAVIFRRTK